MRLTAEMCRCIFNITAAFSDQNIKRSDLISILVGSHYTLYQYLQIITVLFVNDRYFVALYL